MCEGRENRGRREGGEGGIRYERCLWERRKRKIK